MEKQTQYRMLIILLREVLKTEVACKVDQVKKSVVKFARVGIKG